MRDMTRYAKYAACLLLASSSALAAIPNNEKSNSFLGPYLQAGYSDVVYDNVIGYQLLAEGGYRNYRLNGTVAYKADQYQRFKVSAEVLRQSITFPFFSGNTTQWLVQSAAGADYQYNFVDSFLSPIVDLGVFLSYGPSKNLRTATGTYTPTDTGVPTAFTDDRRIGGAFDSSLVGKFAIQPWSGGYWGLNVFYDDVRYDTVYQPTNNPAGAGAGFRIKQKFMDRVDLGGGIDWREPYSSYTANFDIINMNLSGNVAINFDYTFIRGKHSMPSSHNVGMSIHYSPEYSYKKPVKKYKDTKHKDKSKAKVKPINDPRDSFLYWTRDPAIYMPQVLAVPDGNRT